MRGGKIWYPCDISYMNLKPVNEMTSQGYIMRKGIDVLDSEDMNYARIGVVARKNRSTKEVSFDVYYSIDGKFIPYPFDRFNMLFRKSDGGYEFNDSALSEGGSFVRALELDEDCILKCTEDGGLKFQYDDRFMYRHVGINLSFMDYSFIGRFLYKYRRSLILAAKYPNLNTVSDLIEVKCAFEDISHDYWRIRDRDYESDIEYNIKTIHKAEDEIKKLELQRESIFNACADSLNALSEKFGIEIEL